MLQTQYIAKTCYITMSSLDFSTETQEKARSRYRYKLFKHYSSTVKNERVLVSDWSCNREQITNFSTGKGNKWSKIHMYVGLWVCYYECDNGYERGRGLDSSCQLDQSLSRDKNLWLRRSICIEGFGGGALWRYGRGCAGGTAEVELGSVGGT